MIGRRTDRAAAVLVLLAAGCGTATEPVRPEAYSFVEPQTGAIFHWPAGRLPVRYWVDPAAGVVADYVRQGVSRWQEQFLYAEFRGLLVADSSRADVIVSVAGPTPPDLPLTDDPPVFACGGFTYYDLPVDSDQLRGPIIVELNWNPGYDDEDVANCLFRVTVHEVGHTLGILSHSPNDFDLMHANPRVSAPSPLDRVTAETLYHTAPNTLPPERPR